MRKPTRITEKVFERNWVASFDIGIKNLAYCILALDETSNKLPGREIIVKKWDVIDLTFDETNNNCTFLTKSNKLCNKKAVYKENLLYFCKRHKSDNALLIKKPKVKMFDTQTIGTRLIQELDKIPELMEVSTVCIENQPSKNPKMKNLSFLLYSFFIVRSIIDKQQNTNIIFINPRNKLEVYDGPFVPCNLKGQYARNKFYGKIYCKFFVRNQKKEIEFFNSFKKKDDLADCMLQAIWYLKRNTTRTCYSKGKKQIQYENNWNRFKNIRAYKCLNINNYVTLSNIKYSITHDKNWKNVPNIVRGVEFFFGNLEFIEKKLKEL